MEVNSEMHSMINAPSETRTAGAEHARRRLDVASVRNEFPILSREMRPGQRLVYLDSAATSLKPNSVIDTIVEQYRSYTANVHRAIYRLAEEATERYENARQRIAQFIHAKSARQVIFTRGTTESINLVAWTWARQSIRTGDEILLSDMEHHSNLIPWQQAAAAAGAELRFIPLTTDGQLDLSTLDMYLNRRTKLVAITAVSNVLGTVNPIAAIIEMAHAVGARVLVDAAQGVPHLPTDVSTLDCDFLAFSGHKMCGPDGIGVLYGKEELLDGMPPFMTGGQMISRVRRESADWNDLPWKFEAGTPAIAATIGLGAAIDFMSRLGMGAVRQHVGELLAHAYDRLTELEGVHVLGPAPELRSGVVSFTVDGIHPHDLAQLLDRRGIAIRGGHHCAQPLHTRLGIAASARASFYLYNTTEEVDCLLEGIRYAQQIFHR